MWVLFEDQVGTKEVAVWIYNNSESLITNNLTLPSHDKTELTASLEVGDTGQSALREVVDLGCLIMNFLGHFRYNIVQQILKRKKKVKQTIISRQRTVCAGKF